MATKQEAGQAPEAPEIHVTDKRRVTPEGEAAAAADADPPAEAMADAAAEAILLGEIEQLKGQLKAAEEQRAEAERKVAEFSDRFRKAQEQLKAETEEQRARIQRTFEQRLTAARGDIVAQLLDTLDNLKRAVEAAGNSEKREADFDALLEGLRATAAMFEARMVGLGLSAVPSVGEPFNPEIHEAVEMVAVPAEQDNQVIAEYQTGYKYGDRLLRPARVRVGRAGN